jgi:hypothetical protein
MRNRKEKSGVESAGSSSSGTTEEKAASPIVSEWTANEVGAWVERIGLEELKGTFVTHEITGDVLLDITEKDLDYLKIHALGQRKKLLKQIDLLHKCGHNKVQPFSSKEPEVSLHDLDEKGVKSELQGTRQRIEELKKHLTPEQMVQFHKLEQAERAKALRRLSPEQRKKLQIQQEAAKENAFYYMCIQYIITFVLFVVLDQTFGKPIKGWLSGRKAIEDSQHQMIDRLRMENAANQFGQQNQRGPNGMGFP